MLAGVSPWLLLAYLFVPSLVAFHERHRVRLWVRNRRELRAVRKRH